MDIPFIGQAYESRSIPISHQLCINWFPEIEPSDARNVITLQSVSGTKIFVDINVSSVDHIRGMHYSEKQQLLYVVSGNELYQINESGVKTQLGSTGAIAGSDDVAMSDNGTQVGIGNGSTYYVWDATASTLSTVTDSGGGTLAVRDIDYLDGRFILLTSGQTYYITAVGAAQTVNALDTDEAVGNPDDAVGMIVANKRIWIWGTNSFDVYFNSPQAAAAGDFPIVRVEGAGRNGYGLAGRTAKVVQDGTPYWCSNDGVIYRTTGYQPERISNFGIENSIRKYAKLDDCQAVQWIENGHRFVAFSFPAGGETWVYDAMSGMWHQRSSGLNEDVWDVNYISQCWNQRNMVGSRTADKVGELDLDIFTEYGNLMKARRTTPVNHASQNVIFYGRLELVMEGGESQSGEEAMVYLRWSDDSGNLWGNYVSESLGKIGEYNNRVVFYGLGSSVNRVWDLQITYNAPRTLIQAIAEVEVGEV